MWSLMAACDVLVNLRYPTMGETSGSVIRGALARQAAARLRRRLVQRAARRRRAEGAGRRARGARRSRRARLRGRPRRGARRGRARVRRARARPRPRRRRVRRRARGRRRAATRSTTRCSGGSPRRRPRSASTTRRASRAPPSTPGSSRERGRARDSRRCVRGVWLTAIVVGSIVAADRCSRHGSSRRGSWSTSSIYSELAKSFAAHGQFLVRGVPSTATASSTRC